VGMEHSFALPKSRKRALSLVLLSLFFIGIGLSHFFDTDFYLHIMPPFMPFHLGLVYVSGVLEIVGGIGIYFPRLRRWVGACLMLLLVAVYPVNIYMAVYPALFPEFSPTFLYIRLALQFVFLFWVYKTTLAPEELANLSSAEMT